MREYTQMGVGCILMFNDTIDEVLLHASEDEAKARLKEKRMLHFKLQRAMNPSLRLDDYDHQYIWHIDYAPILAPVVMYPKKRELDASVNKTDD